MQSRPGKFVGVIVKALAFWGAVILPIFIGAIVFTLKHVTEEEFDNELQAVAKAIHQIAERELAEDGQISETFMEALSFMVAC